MKEIKDSGSLTEIFSIAKITIFSKWLNRFNKIFFKILIAFFFFCINGQADPKTHTVMLTSQVDLEKTRSEDWHSQFQNLLQYYSNPNSVGLHKHRRTDKQYRIESPERNPYIYGQLIFDKGAKTIPRTKNSLFNKWCRDTAITFHEF